MSGRDRIRKIIALLRKAYGKAPRFKLTNPVDELIRTVLSQNTSDTNSLKAYGALKRAFKSWEDLLFASTRHVASVIRHGGLAKIKAERIKAILREIDSRESRISLGRLRSLTTQEGLAYLRSLKGVGPKTSSCVMLFSFGRPAMPVDTHIFRVAKRLGFLKQNIDIAAAHEVLTKRVPQDLIYEFHLGIIEHGRRTCKAQNPRCGACVLFKICHFKDKRRYCADQKS